MSKDKFTGEYEIEDGYVGGRRPQHFAVTVDLLADDMTDDDLRKLYEQEAEDHFRMNLGISPRRVEEFIAWAREKIAGSAHSVDTNT